MPTSEWKAATSSGIAVMGMRRAVTAPMPPPMATPPTIIAQVSGSFGCATAKRRDHGNRHAGHAEIVPAPRRLGRRQPAQRQDEEDARDEIEQRDEIRAHFFFFWYMPSMRWVTRKPPKMLTLAMSSAAKPSSLVRT